MQRPRFSLAVKTPSNKSLERPGTHARVDITRASAGRSAPSRWAELRSYIFLTFSGEACFGW